MLVLLLTACDQDTEKKLGLLPPAQGAFYELILVMDTIQRNGPLGDAVKALLAEDMPGMYGTEPYFTVRYIEPYKFGGLLKEFATIITVMTLDNSRSAGQRMKSMFSPESLQKIQQDTAFFMQAQQDQYAAGQTILNLFGRNEAELIRHLRSQKTRLRSFLLKREIERLQARITKDGGEDDLARLVARRSGVQLHLPKGYQLAKETAAGKAGFVWLRYPEAVLDLNIMISWMPYEAQTQFAPEAITARRDTLTAQHIFGDPANPASYVLIEPEVPVHTEAQDFKGMYAVEARGMWRTATRTMGGNFVSLTLLDQARQRVVTLDGFTYAPHTSKRQILREMEAVLRTAAFDAK